jgi:WD40 repeat protein
MGLIHFVCVPKTGPHLTTLLCLGIFLFEDVPLILFSRFIGTLRAHVGPVYRVTWSSDSRLLVSGSEDSTIKLWDVKVRHPCLCACLGVVTRCGIS